MRITVVVPTCRRADVLTQTLSAMLAVDYPPSLRQVVVVDDANDAATEACVRRLARSAPDLHYVPGRRRGAATARNDGARRADGDLLLFCDDDIVVSHDHLRLHLATRQRFGDALVNGLRWYSPNLLSDLLATPFGRYRVTLEEGFERDRAGRPLGGRCFEAAGLSSCNLMLSRELFWKLGGFDEAFSYAGTEDQELAVRARATGCLLVRNHDIRLSHNDPTLTLRQFGAREERGAETVVVLAQKVPEVSDSPMMRKNRPVMGGDPWNLVAVKLVKALLASTPAMTVLHRLVWVLERAGLPELWLRAIYSRILGLHIFRGIRTGTRRGSET